MKHIKRIVAIAIVGCAATVGAGTITAKTDTTADEAIVGAMAAAPVRINVLCFEPTRANLAYLRTDCDLTAEKYGYGHGVLRPANEHDEVDENWTLSCVSPNEVYVCLAVGGR